MTVVCAQCSVEFTPKRKDRVAICCSRLCARRRNVRKAAARSHALHPQAGENNRNFKGWASKRPYAYVRRHRAANPEQLRCQRVLRNAILTGRVVRPSACSVCALPCRPEGHHEDYAKPLVVVWTCRKCHVGLDAARRQREQHARTLQKAS